MASPSRLLPASSPPSQQTPPCLIAPASSPHPLIADLPLHRHAPDPAPLLEPLSSPPSLPLPGVLDSPQNHLRSANPAQPPPRPGGSLCFSAGRSSSSGRAPAAAAAAAATGTQAAPFLKKMYNLVDDEGTDAVISWNARGDGFVVWDTRALCQGLLPRYFRHGDFATFIRQLTTYGFRKINPERWEFVKSDFLRGHRHLLGGIHRKASANAGAPHHHYHHHQPHYMVGSSPPSLLVSASDASLGAGEYQIREQLNVLKTQVCRLRQQVQQAEGQCQALWQRLQLSKSCEKHMLRFIVRARQDPSFLSRLAQQYAAESLEMAKRQRLKIHMMDEDTASGICDARRANQQACSVQSMETKRSLEMEAMNESQTQLALYPLRAQQSEENTADTASSTEVAECSSQESNINANTVEKYL